MTPSFMGRIATMFPGVRPSISLASLPTASTSLVVLLIATIDGSLTTMPLPFAKTSVLAVPRSMARSLEKKLKSMCRFIEGIDLLLPLPFIICLDVPYCRWLLDSNGLAQRGDLSSAVLRGHCDLVGAGISQRRREVLEGAVRRNVENRFVVDQHGGAGFGAANDLDHAAVLYVLVNGQE